MIDALFEYVNTLVTNFNNIDSETSHSWMQLITCTNINKSQSLLTIVGDARYEV